MVELFVIASRSRRALPADTSTLGAELAGCTGCAASVTGLAFGALLARRAGVLDGELGAGRAEVASRALRLVVVRTVAILASCAPLTSISD